MYGFILLHTDLRCHENNRISVWSSFSSSYNHCQHKVCRAVSSEPDFNSSHELCLHTQHSQCHPRSIATTCSCNSSDRKSRCGSKRQKKSDRVEKFCSLQFFVELGRHGQFSFPYTQSPWSWNSDLQISSSNASLYADGFAYSERLGCRNITFCTAILVVFIITYY